MTVRNACVARGRTTPTATGPVWTVPAGFVLLLKHAGFRPADNIDWSMALTIVASNGSDQLLVEEQTLTAGEFFNWNGWVAANGGDAVWVSTWSTDCYYWLSGALLPYAVGPDTP